MFYKTKAIVCSQIRMKHIKAVGAPCAISEC